MDSKVNEGTILSLGGTPSGVFSWKLLFPAQDPLSFHSKQRPERQLLSGSRPNPKFMNGELTQKLSKLLLRDPRDPDTLFEGSGAGFFSGPNQPAKPLGGLGFVVSY